MLGIMGKTSFVFFNFVFSGNFIYKHYFKNIHLCEENFTNIMFDVEIIKNYQIYGVNLRIRSKYRKIRRNYSILLSLNSL